MDSKRNTANSNGDAPIPIPIPIHTIHTYNTYIHTYIPDSEIKTPTFQDFINYVEKQRKKHVTTTFPPLLWDTFRECVKKRESLNVKANHLLEKFMKKYIRDSFIQFNNQVQLTQFFINKPERVNITRKQVIIKKHKRIDYSKLTLEQLEKEYWKAEKQDDYARIQTILFELKRLGVPINRLRKQK